MSGGGYWHATCLVLGERERIVEVAELLPVFLLALFGGEAERMDAIDQDLGRFRLRPQNLHGLGDEFSERYRSWIARLMCARQFGLHI